MFLPLLVCRLAGYLENSRNFDIFWSCPYPAVVKKQGAPSFSILIFHDFSMTKKMKIHDISAQHIFPSKRHMTYESIPELVVIVPSARSTIVKRIKRFIIWLYKWSRVTFTELISAVEKFHDIIIIIYDFSMTFHDLCYFPWLSRPGKWSSQIPWSCDDRWYTVKRYSWRKNRRKEANRKTMMCKALDWMMNRDDGYTYQNLKEMAQCQRTWIDLCLEPAIGQIT